jgi:hypothetical protein
MHVVQAHVRRALHGKASLVQWVATLRHIRNSQMNTTALSGRVRNRSWQENVWGQENTFCIMFIHPNISSLFMDAVHWWIFRKVSRTTFIIFCYGFSKWAESFLDWGPCWGCMLGNEADELFDQGSTDCEVLCSACVWRSISSIIWVCERKQGLIWTLIIAGNIPLFVDFQWKYTLKQLLLHKQEFDPKALDSLLF